MSAGWRGTRSLHPDAWLSGDFEQGLGTGIEQQVKQWSG